MLKLMWIITLNTMYIPKAKIKEIHLYRIELEEAVISDINNERIIVLDETVRNTV